MPPAVQRRERRSAAGWKVGGDFGHHLVEGEAVDPGQDEGPQLGVGFQPGQRSAAMLGAPVGGVQRGFKLGFNALLKGR